MERRRRQPPRSSAKLPPRLLRRPLYLLRRFFAARDWQYFLVSITLFLLLIALIFSLASDDDFALAYPPLLSRNSTLSNSHYLDSGTALAVSGTAHELETLLTRVTNGSTNGKLVVAVAVNYAFRRLALNFVCNLNRLGVKNYIVLAMDRAVFDYLAMRSANSFFYNEVGVGSRRLLSADRNLLHDEGNTEEDAFGSAAFVETSRRKSILVLKVLRLGYSVVFSDVDVVWIRNPIPDLLSHDFDFVIQSDRAYADRDTALNYNLNSGFYLVRSTRRAVTALQAIVKYASAIRRSEQKAFNYVLCGAFKDHHAGPGTRVGANECTYGKVGATAQMLPLEAFPNGSDESLWVNGTEGFAKTHPDVVAVHANYVQGWAEKVDRIKHIGFWFHSEESHTIDECVPLVSRVPLLKP